MTDPNGRHGAAFIIRFHYSENDKRFIWRLNFFKKYVLPKIKAQTVKSFDIWVWTNPKHDNLFIDLGCNVFHSPENRKYNVNGYYHDFIKYEQLQGLPKYKIQVGLDSDDFIEPDYYNIIFTIVLSHCIKYNNKKTLHICFQPTLLNLMSGKKTKMRTYNETRGSAFMALYQPLDVPYRFIYEESHISIITKAEIKIVVPAGYCYAVSHKLNESTGKSKNEIKNNKFILV